MIAAALVGAGCGSSDGSGAAGSSPHPLMTAEFSDFRSGETLTLADIADTPIVVNLWASTCPSCIHEMPDFETVSQEYAGEVTFIGIGLDEDRNAAERLVADTGVTYQLGNDDNGIFVDLLGVIAMPTTAFIDDDGSLVEVRGGQLTAQALRDQIEAHLISAVDQEAAAPPALEIASAAASADDTFDVDYLDLDGGLFPALDDPAFVPASTAVWLEADDVVMGVVADSGEAQAYPVGQMAFHHVANSRLAGEPFVVTY